MTAVKPVPSQSSPWRQRLLEIVAAHRRIVAITGAGMSTASGIPDFRGPQGLWTKNPQAARLFRIDDYIADAQLRQQAWQTRLHHPIWQAEPTAAHHGLTQLAATGRDLVIVTQNIDGLHSAADPQGRTEVLEMHGSMHRVICLNCQRRQPMPATLARVRSGEVDPGCLACGGILKSDTISFGQALDVNLLHRAAQAVTHCSLLLVLGTTLQVNPVAGLLEVARATRTELVIINEQPTRVDSQATLVIHQSLEEVVPWLVSQLEQASVGQLA